MAELSHQNTYMLLNESHHTNASTSFGTSQDLDKRLEALQALRASTITLNKVDEALNLDEKDVLQFPIIEFCEQFIKAKSAYKDKQALVDSLTQVKEEIDRHKSVLSGIVFSLPLNPQEKEDIISTVTNYAYQCISKLELSKHLEQLQEYTRYYEVVNPLLTQIRKDLTETSLETDVPICSICFEEKISHAIVPCGHTICDDCRKKLSGSCFTCRGSYHQVIKLFMQ